jgi:predicted nucleic acid-binding protein
MTVFADTFALIAWLNPRDDAHAKVAAYLGAFTGRLVTTEWVFMELADALSAPGARMTAAPFLQAVRADPCSMSSPTSRPYTGPVSTYSPTARTKPGR